MALLRVGRDQRMGGLPVIESLTFIRWSSWSQTMWVRRLLWSASMTPCSWAALG